MLPPWHSKEKKKISEPTQHTLTHCKLQIQPVFPQEDKTITMGDSAKVAKAKRELEELYSGVPDESVNLTFGDLAQVRQPNGRPHPPLERTNSPPLDPITEASPRREEVSPLARMPSLDFSRGLEASAQFNYQSKHIPHVNHHHHMENYNNSPMNHNHLEKGHDHHHRYSHGETPLHRHVMGSPYDAGNHHGHGMQKQKQMQMPSSMVYDEKSQMSGFPERSGRRRPGIPHSNICTVCSTYIYVFRHRCLVIN